MNNTLINAVVLRVGRENLRDVVEHGADCGFSGFVYYHETSAFYGRHKKTINQMAEELADDLGEEVLQMVAKFRCLDGQYSTVEVAKTMYGRRTQKEQNDLVQIDNALAWFALEEVARFVVEGQQ